MGERLNIRFPPSWMRFLIKGLQKIEQNNMKNTKNKQKVTIKPPIQTLTAYETPPRIGDRDSCLEEKLF